MSVCNCHGVIFMDCPNVKAGRSLIATKVPDADEKRYSQREADALIAGAYLAVDAMISKGWHSDQCASLRNQWHIDDPEACDCWNGLLRASVRELSPDAARLALEEREKQLKDELARIYKTNSHNAELYVEAEDKWKRYEREQPAREAKLIADTRLETRRQMLDALKSNPRFEDIARWLERHLEEAAHRAAVQEGKDDVLKKS